jgi:pyridoxal phosphate enzyme (YggS family)
MSLSKSEISNRIKKLNEEIQGRAVLIAVTKYSPVEDLIAAYKAGLYLFGENRVLDLKEKADYFKSHNLDRVQWNFIGNLQTNKVKSLFSVPGLVAIHSVSSLKLLKELIKHQSILGNNKIKLFIEINTGNEDEKTGLLLDEQGRFELNEMFDLLLNHAQKNLELYGLMTMAPIRTSDYENGARNSFQTLLSFKKELDTKYFLSLKLSMGMSSDYKIALEYQSDFIRVGSAIFK